MIQNDSNDDRRETFGHRLRIVIVSNYYYLSSSGRLSAYIMVIVVNNSALLVPNSLTSQERSTSFNVCIFVSK